MASTKSSNINKETPNLSTNNAIKILNKDTCRFELIYNVPSSIVEESEKVESLLENDYNYDLRKISWISVVDFNPNEQMIAIYDYNYNYDNIIQKQ